MTESIATTWNDKRDAAYFALTETVVDDRFAADTAQLTTAEIAGNDLAAQIERMLEELVVAESWESTAIRSVARHHRDLVPVPVIARRAAM